VISNDSDLRFRCALPVPGFHLASSIRRATSSLGHCGASPPTAWAATGGTSCRRRSSRPYNCRTRQVLTRDRSVGRRSPVRMC
jgi:hypothetical protein